MSTSSIWSQRYTQSDLEKRETDVYNLLRVANLQGAVKILIPDNTPTNQDGYENARKAASQHIQMQQPLIDPTYTGSYRVVFPPEQALPPLLLLRQWERIAVLGMAMNRYESELGVLAGALTTACQFGDDNILLSHVEMQFAIATLLIPMEIYGKDLYETGMVGAKALTDENDSHCVRNHSDSIKALCLTFFNLLMTLAPLNDPNARLDRIQKFGMQTECQGLATGIDLRTNNRLKVKDWVFQKVNVQ